jgi:transposase-like protein
MGQMVVSMEAKLLAMFSSGVPLNVTTLCRELQISRQTLYKYRRRFEAEGPAGLVERSRRPRSSPRRVLPETEDAIVRLRKELRVDCGAQAIAYQLARRGHPIPSVATIHRVLVRRGMVTPQPRNARTLPGDVSSGPDPTMRGRSTRRRGRHPTGEKCGSWMFSMTTLVPSSPLK